MVPEILDFGNPRNCIAEGSFRVSGKPIYPARDVTPECGDLFWFEFRELGVEPGGGIEI